MLNKYLLIILILIAPKISLAENLDFQPDCVIGYKHNDNIELSNTDALQSTSLYLDSGINAAYLINADLSAYASIAKSINIFNEKEYGYLSNNFSQFGLSYDYFYNLQILNYVKAGSFEDSIVSEYDYSFININPQIKYFLSNMSVFILDYELAEIKYSSLADKGKYEKSGFSFYQGINDYLHLTSGYYLHSDSSLGYEGNEINIEAYLNLYTDNYLLFRYTGYLLDYSERKDKKSIFQFQFTKPLNSSLALILDVYQINNSSSLDDYSYENNVLMLSLRYKPEFLQIKAISPNKMYYQKGIDALYNENYSYAEKQLKKVTLWYEDFGDPYYELGYIYHKNKKYRKAIQNLTKAIELLPEKQESYYLLADCYFELNKPKEATKILNKKLKN